MANFLLGHGLVGATFALFAIYLARGLGRRWLGWGVAGFLLGPLVALILLAIAPLPNAPRAAAWTRPAHVLVCALVFPLLGAALAVLAMGPEMASPGAGDGVVSTTPVALWDSLAVMLGLGGGLLLGAFCAPFGALLLGRVLGNGARRA